LHDDVNTILGHGLLNFTKEPSIESGKLVWREGAKESLNASIVRPVSDPFKPEGGIKVLKGNIGRSVIKSSAVDNEHLIVEAPAVVFDEQEDFIAAFKRGELNKDLIAVLAFQGPKQNGMPELHQLTPSLTILQKRGYKVALLTDGRMSGASGKVPAAIHMVPEASDGGFIGKIQTGDLLRLDAVEGTLECLTEGVEERTVRTKKAATHGLGRELFAQARRTVSDSEQGASFII
jgi:phosphogluconate dehydratase